MLESKVEKMIGPIFTLPGRACMNEFANERALKHLASELAIRVKTVTLEIQRYC